MVPLCMSRVDGEPYLFDVNPRTVRAAKQCIANRGSLSAGETVRFCIKKLGIISQEMVIGSIADLEAHVANVQKTRGIQHTEPTMNTLALCRLLVCLCPGYPQRCRHEEGENAHLFLKVIDKRLHLFNFPAL